MALSIGIVGLPNVGKSTTFNALTKEQNAEAANYPFCKIEPNKAIVTVPDDRIDTLAELVKPERLIYATIEFVDIAGLVSGASRGEGLGNKFLGQIRETSAIIHVVRCFDDDNVVHVNAKPDPKSDIETIDIELALADLEQFERKIERLTKQIKGDKSLQPIIEAAEGMKAILEEGLPVSEYQGNEAAVKQLVDELEPLTAKTIIFAANVDEAGLAQDNDYVASLRAVAADKQALVIKLCAKIEEEMAGLSDEERQEFLEELGTQESGLDQVIHASYEALGLISFFTAGPKEVRAWTIPKRTTAPEAAGVIHTDFERGFIRAEVIPYATYIQHGSEAAAKAAGDMGSEGKEYIVQDGDVMHFRFNV